MRFHLICPFIILSASMVLLCPETVLSQDAGESSIAMFESQRIDDIEIGYGLAIGDVDGDGKNDVLLADKREIVWYRNPGWKKHIIASRLTLRDNVCLAARDLDGDGKVEIAVGANWNPGNTSSVEESGAVFYMVRPDKASEPWKPVKLTHDPTTHRMHWVRDGKGKYSLVVLPLHGIDNRGGQGENGVRVMAYHVPENPEDASAWKTEVLDESMHMTHNFDVIANSGDGADKIVIGGREGIVTLVWKDGKWQKEMEKTSEGFGEIRRFGNLTAGIRPMHGNKVTVSTEDGIPLVLDESLNAGHAIAIGDILGIGRPQVVAGWRSPDENKKVGIRLYVPGPDADDPWKKRLIDDNQMACEDLKITDLNADGKLDIVAAGRATKNVVIYWNRRN